MESGILVQGESRCASEKAPREREREREREKGQGPPRARLCSDLPLVYHVTQRASPSGLQIQVDPNGWQPTHSKTQELSYLRLFKYSSTLRRFKYPVPASF
jgi:hypothetical protein